MSNRKSKSTLHAEIGGRSADQISPSEAIIYALSSNMMAIALGDVADAKERVMRARQQLVRNQPNITLSMRRQIEGVESYVLDAIEQLKNDAPTIH